MDVRSWEELDDAERQDVIADVCRVLEAGRVTFLIRERQHRHFWKAIQAIGADYSDRHPEIF